MQKISSLALLLSFLSVPAFTFSPRIGEPTVDEEVWKLQERGMRDYLNTSYALVMRLDTKSLEDVFLAHTHINLIETVAVETKSPRILREAKEKLTSISQDHKDVVIRDRAINSIRRIVQKRMDEKTIRWGVETLIHILQSPDQPRAGGYVYYFPAATAAYELQNIHLMLSQSEIHFDSEIISQIQQALNYTAHKDTSPEIKKAAHNAVLRIKYELSRLQ